MAAVRLARHVVTLEDGHRVGVTVAGRGMPFVVAHGFGAQGILYAQTLSRLVGMGFKVVAIDVPGHGRTGLPRHAPFDLSAYADVIRRAVGELGIRRAVMAGHSMGGRLVIEAAAAAPDRTVALVLVDAIAGESWDQMINRLRRCPIAASVLLARLAVDTVSTVPMRDDTHQSLKLASLLARTGSGLHLLTVAAPVLAIVLAQPSVPFLDHLGASGVPSMVLHGAGDLAVPLSAARDAACRLNADLAAVAGARHSWLLSDPETLPAIVGRFLSGALGDAWTSAVLEAGLDPAKATIDDIEQAMYEPDAVIVAITPPLTFTRTAERRQAARYQWAVERPSPT